VSPLLVVTLSRVAVRDDAVSLLIHHVKRQSSVHVDDKRKIKRLLRQTLASLLHMSCAMEPVSDDEDEQDDELIDDDAPADQQQQQQLDVTAARAGDCCHAYIYTIKTVWQSYRPYYVTR